MGLPSRTRSRALVAPWLLALAAFLLVVACQAPAGGAATAGPDAPSPTAESPATSAAPTDGGYDYGY